MTGRLLGHLRGGGAVYADAAYEKAQLQKENEAEALCREIFELARSRGYYVTNLKLEVARRGRRSA